MFPVILYDDSDVILYDDDVLGHHLWQASVEQAAGACSSRLAADASGSFGKRGF